MYTSNRLASNNLLLLLITLFLVYCMYSLSFRLILPFKKIFVDFSNAFQGMKALNFPPKIQKQPLFLLCLRILAMNYCPIFHPLLLLSSISHVCRSTKSEKTYPSMLSRMTATEIETEPYYCLPVNGGIVAAWSQPTSPTPRNLTGLISPTHSSSPHRFVYHGSKKNDEGKKFEINLHFFFN